MNRQPTSAHQTSAVRRRLRPVAAVLALLAGLLSTGSGATGTASAEVVPAPASGTWTVQGHGFGHGHGLSQYGARGAARDGLTAAQIIAFYYSGTTLRTLSQPVIRVRITDDGGATTAVLPAGQRLTLHWPAGSLTAGPANGSRLRLVAAAAGKLQPQLYTSSWVNWGGAIAGPADITSTAGFVRLLTSSGSTEYRGSVGSVIDPNLGRITVNRLALDAYVQGVVPREMPASWEPAAVQSQAIAARSYARYAVEHSGGASYDICDSTNCQVYGGKARYDGSGALQYAEDPAANQAVAATANQVATYAGATIFAQFSSSDGGWTADGGQPYLTARADPYEAAAGDPFLNWTTSVAVADVASYYGLSRVTQLSITARDGHGEWGGRVQSAVVSGLDSGGHPTSVTTSGYSLASAMGLRHEWFHITAIAPSAPASASATGADAAGLVSWQPPATTGSDPITGYSVTVAGQPPVTVAGSARSTWIGNLRNGQRYTAAVRAVNSAGAGAATTVSFTPTAHPQQVQAVTPSRLFDSRSGHVLTTPTNPLVYGVGGHGSIPVGATAVQLAVTVVTPTAGGSLRIYNDGSAANGTAAISYAAGVVTTSTVSVPLTTSGRVTFRPSAGAMYLIADQVGYSTAGASRITASAPGLLLDTASIGTAGRTVTLGTGVPAQGGAVALQILGSSSQGAGWIRVWSGSGPAPSVSQISVPAGSRRANTVIVPLGTGRTIRVAASAPFIGGQLSVVGVLSGTGGLLETVPTTGVSDSTARSGSDLSVSSAGSRLVLAGVGQLPAAGGFTAALLHVTCSSATAATQLRVYADGAASPRAVTVALLPGVNTTTTVLVPVSAAGAIRLATSGGSTRVAVDVAGYLTAG